MKERTLDTNVACYVANGVWHHYLSHPRLRLPRSDVPDSSSARSTSRSTINTRPARSNGTLITNASTARARCSPDRRASIRRCGVRSRPPNGWDANAPTGKCHSARSRSRSRTGPSAFSTKNAGRWTGTTRSSSGVLRGHAAEARLAAKWDTFVAYRARRALRFRSAMGHGSRNVRARDGTRRDRSARSCARTLFEWVQFLRHDDGSYWTGMNFAGDRYDELGRILHRRAADVEQRRGRARRERARRQRRRQRVVPR